MANSRASFVSTNGQQRKPVRDFTTLSIESGAARSTRVSRNYGNSDEFFDQAPPQRSFLSEDRGLVTGEKAVSAGLKVPFYKTKPGIIVLCVVGGLVGLCVIGAIIGVTYYAGSLNARNITLTSSESSTLDSVILTTTERATLTSMGNFRTFALCYRATRDGFFTPSFHRLCDNRPNTITIIRSHLNSVFGGYAQVSWTVGGFYRNDPNAWLFSLRRRGLSNTERFNCTNSNWAIFNAINYGPTFGSAHDLFIADNSDIVANSNSNFCSSYQCPTLFVTGNTYLAGAQTFFTTEIEVFVVTF